MKLESLPRETIFLAGPTKRGGEPTPWRSVALEILEKSRFNGGVFIPEYSDGSFGSDWGLQVRWETEALSIATVILFWVPRDLREYPALTTNAEFGLWVDSGKIVYGRPNEAPKNRYLDWHCQKREIPINNSLEKTVQLAIEKCHEKLVD